MAISVIFPKSVKVSKDGVKLNKKQECLKGILDTLKIGDKEKIDVKELWEPIFKSKIKDDKVKASDLPFWNDLVRVCLNDQYWFLNGSTKSFYTMHFSRTGSTAWLSRQTMSSLITTKFEVKEEKVAEDETVMEEVPATEKASDSELLRVLSHQVASSDLASILERLASIGVEGWKSESAPKEVAIA